MVCVVFMMVVTAGAFYVRLDAGVKNNKLLLFFFWDNNAMKSLNCDNSSSTQIKICFPLPQPFHYQKLVYEFR